MAGYDTGGGGGRAQSETVSGRIAFAKPYDIPGQWSPEVANQLDEMLRQLYDAANRVDDVGLKLTGTVASDENLVVFDGTSGTLVKDGGVLATDVLVSRIVLTDSQIQSLNTTPVEVIAAPASTKAINVIGCMFLKDATAGAYSAAPTLSLRFNGIAVDLTTGVSVFLSSANFSWARAALPTANQSSNSRGTSVVVRASADVTGGNAANSVVVQAVYALVTDNS